MGKIINNLYEAKTHLSELVERAARGEEVIIAKNGVPMVRLVRIEKPKRPGPGGWEGRGWIADDFDDPLPDELLDAFEGKDEPSP